MKKSAIISIVILGMLVINGFSNVFAERTAEIEAVRRPLESYLMGHKTGDSKYMKIAMHTEGKLMYIRDGKYTTVDFKDYIDRMRPRLAKDEAQRRRYIESIEITGNVAVAKLIIKYPTVHFTDYMTLLKMNGEWKIVNKVAYSVRDPKNNQAESADIGAARIPLENYIKGHKTGQAEYMRKAFHTDGKLMSLRDGKFTTVDFEQFFGYFKGTPAKDEAMRKRRIESIKVTGNIAVGKVILDHPNVKFTDYMVLLKINDEWKIVNKAFFMEQKTQK
jgi:hypothetical protein